MKNAVERKEHTTIIVSTLSYVTNHCLIIIINLFKFPFYKLSDLAVSGSKEFKFYTSCRIEKQQHNALFWAFLLIMNFLMLNFNFVPL